MSIGRKSFELRLQHLRHMSFLQVCNLITDSDEELFSRLRKQYIIDYSEGINNERVTKVGERWDRMCRVVLECAIVNRRLGHSIGKLAKICSSGPFLVQSAENDGSAYFMREISTPLLL